MPRDQTPSSLVDALGQVRQTIADLRSRELILTGKISRLGVGFYEGKLYNVDVALRVDNHGGVQVFVTKRNPIRR